MLFISGVPIEAQLVGPAIRCRKLAQQVSAVAEVTVAAPKALGRCAAGLATRVFATADELMDLARRHDVIVAQGAITLVSPQLLLLNQVKIFDLYAPLNLEALEHVRHAPTSERERHWRNAQTGLHGQITAGDFFLCANERQRRSAGLGC